MRHYTIAQMQLFAYAAAEERVQRIADMGLAFRASRSQRAYEALVTELGLE